MPNNDETVTPQLATILEGLSESEGEVAPQERFSAAGITFSAALTAATIAATPPIAPVTAPARSSSPEDVGMAADISAIGETAPSVLAQPEPAFERKDRKDIQGNIVPGFNKDYQHFLFYRIRDPKAAKEWLRWIAPKISSMDEVLAFNRAYRVMRFRLGKKDVPIKATWVNIAFSFPAIKALVSKAAGINFGEQSFTQGLAARSEYLGDPTDPKAAGNKRKWVVGGPKNEADILVIVASDDPKLLDGMVDGIRKKADKHRLELIFEQSGATLPDKLRGHEHFGFKDGISQPAVRGRASDAPDDYVTPRYFEPSDPRSRLFAKPGQLLVWRGQFLLGFERQDPEDLYEAAAAAKNFPSWARCGSYLVVRRLQQDVKTFWEFAAETAAGLGIPAEQFASILVGRWPSGAPVIRTPGADIPELGADDLASNHFLFEDDTRPSNLIPIPGYPGDAYTQARGDLLGNVCPHFAHVRKVNPRDSSTDLGKTADSLIRMIMRRGIPFGPPVVGQKSPPAGLWKKERGLMFLCYQGSIEDQFEFLTRRWSNSQVQPNFGGHDPIIGQEGSQGVRERFIDFPKDGKTVRISLKKEWVIPTGGGYFFAPPISAIAGVLGT